MLRRAAVGLLLRGCAERGAPPVAPTSDVRVAPIGSVEVEPAELPRSGAFRIGEHVEVEWNASWWPAVVVAIEGDGWLIHYDNYGKDWDEVVGVDRIRRAGDTEKEPEDEPAP